MYSTSSLQDATGQCMPYTIYGYTNDEVVRCYSMSQTEVDYQNGGLNATVDTYLSDCRMSIVNYNICWTSGNSSLTLFGGHVATGYHF